MQIVINTTYPHYHQQTHRTLHCTCQGSFAVLLCEHYQQLLKYTCNNTNTCSIQIEVCDKTTLKDYELKLEHLNENHEQCRRA